MSTPPTPNCPFGWRWRYSGIGAGAPVQRPEPPLSRSWNRAYLMTGMELDNRWNVVHARIWKRLPESATSDDNPGISDYIGRGEVKAFWNVDKDNTLAPRLRHSLSGTGRGSAAAGMDANPGHEAWAVRKATCACTPSCFRATATA
jgi:phospholipase A1